MPLLDHFHPPLSSWRTWEEFHGLWAATLVERLNGDILGDEHYAAMQVHVGGAVEVDVATLTERQPAGGAAVATPPPWSPAAARHVAPVVFPDDIEVQVYSTAAGATLAGAIELVSPGNKDRPEARRAFAAKCVAYVTRGVGVVVVDVVTNRLANLHNEVVGLLGLGPPVSFDPAPPTYAVAYRPARRADGDRVEMWTEPLAVGDDLPVLPLGLRNADTVPVDLAATYADACVRARLTRR